jgi:FkbM family methyltransferase
MKIYIDCGTHLGEGLKKHIEQFGIDEKWKVYTFEANKFTFDLLQKLKNENNFPQKYNWLNWKNISFYNKAVWIDNCKKTFFCSKPRVSVDEIRNSEMNSFMSMHDRMVIDGDLVTSHQRDDLHVDGSSSLVPENFKDYLNNNGNFIQKNLEWSKEILVDCFDFSSWLRENIKEDDYVVCKIDIEGAEFEVLKKCIKDDTLKLINHLDIEFHHFDNVELKNQYHSIINEIEKCKIEFRVW